MAKPSPQILRERAFAGYMRLRERRTPDFLDYADDHEYRERIEYELSVFDAVSRKNVAALGYGEWSDFLLVTADYANAVRERGVFIGGGRGSAAASLVCLCLGITTGIDPLRFGLIFERFLNPDRVSVPDIDLDFSDQGIVFDYLVERYGANRVVRISTPQLLKPKSAIGKAAEVFGMSRPDWHKVTDIYERVERDQRLWQDYKDVDPAIIDAALEASDELRAYEERFPELFPLAKRFVGLLSGFGTHPAGVLICAGPAGAETPLIRVGSGKNAALRTAYDCKTLEKQGWVKCDILSVTNLRIIVESLDHVRDRHGVELTPEEIPLVDAQTSKLFTDGDIKGIFQIGDNHVARRLCSELPAESVDDVSLINALIRPGIEWEKTAENKQYPDQVWYPTEQLRTILADSYGIFTYQEQIMFACQQLAGFSMADADKVRRVVATTANAALMYDIDNYREQFIDGCLDNGIPMTSAAQVWESIKALANYCFNKTICEHELVATVRGNIPIRDVRAGDFVLAIESVGGKLISTEVVALHDHGVVPLVEVEFDDGSTVRCTRDHKFDTPEGTIPLYEAEARNLRVRCYESVDQAGARASAFVQEGTIQPPQDQTGDDAQGSSSAGISQSHVRDSEADIGPTGDSETACGAACEVASREPGEVRCDQSCRSESDAERESTSQAECVLVEGEVLVQDKGRVVLRRIVRVQEIGEGQGYDIEVRHKDHTFLLANGVSSSNSHAISYGVIAWQEGYIKARWSAEYLCACINDVVRKGPQFRDQYEGFVEDAKRHGIQVIPPTVNESKGMCHVNDSGDIVLGLCMVKNVGSQGDKACKNAPYADYKDFCSRSGIPTVAVRETMKKHMGVDGLFPDDALIPLNGIDDITLSLLYAGALDCLHDRRDMLYCVDPEMDPTPAMMASMEEEHVGFFVSTNPLAHLGDMMRRWIQKDSDPRRRGTGGGLVVDVRTSRNGHGFLKVKTLRGSLDLVCWANEWAMHRATVHKGAIIKGGLYKTKRDNFAISDIEIYVEEGTEADAAS